MNESLLQQIHSGVKQLGLALAANLEEQLEAYLSLLAKWNRSYNLTAVRAENDMVSQHLLDSLALLPYLDANLPGMGRLADVGSGGGLPGIPVAIARPQLRVELIEANHKKASFLQQAKIELKLTNVSIYCGRVERYKPGALFDAAVSRAFSSLADFVSLAAHLLVPEGRLLAMKGVHPQEEIEQLPAGWKMLQSIPLVVPELHAHRALIVIGKA